MVPPARKEIHQQQLLPLQWVLRQSFLSAFKRNQKQMKTGKSNLLISSSLIAAHALKFPCRQLLYPLNLLPGIKSVCAILLFLNIWTIVKQMFGAKWSQALFCQAAVQVGGPQIRLVPGVESIVCFSVLKKWWILFFLFFFFLAKLHFSA